MPQLSKVQAKRTCNYIKMYHVGGHERAVKLAAPVAAQHSNWSALRSDLFSLLLHAAVAAGCQQNCRSTQALPWPHQVFVQLVDLLVQLLS
jgi:hypothetical protein